MELLHFSRGGKGTHTILTHRARAQARQRHREPQTLGAQGWTQGTADKESGAPQHQRGAGGDQGKGSSLIDRVSHQWRARGGVRDRQRRV